MPGERVAGLAFAWPAFRSEHLLVGPSDVYAGVDDLPVVHVGDAVQRVGEEFGEIVPVTSCLVAIQKVIVMLTGPS